MFSKSQHEESTLCDGASYSQDDSKSMSKLFFFVDDMVIELQLDVEAQMGINALECILQRAERVVCFDVPSQNPPVFGLPKQWLPHLSSNGARKISISQSKCSSNKNRTTFAGSLCGP